MCVRLLPHVWRRATMSAICIALVPTLVSACGGTNRTATNFCRQVEREMPGLGVLPATQSDIDVLVSRYQRISEVAPTAVADDWRALTSMLTDASKLNTANSADVEDFTKDALQANKAAARALQWVKDTCGIDLSGFPPASQ